MRERDLFEAIRQELVANGIDHASIRIRPDENVFTHVNIDTLTMIAWRAVTDYLEQDE